jgi:Fe-S oxidoreductase
LNSICVEFSHKIELVDRRLQFNRPKNAVTWLSICHLTKIVGMEKRLANLVNSPLKLLAKAKTKCIPALTIRQLAA